MFLLIARLVRINLFDYMNITQYLRTWRHRINLLRVYFLDEDENVIPNNDDLQEGLFGMGVMYPKMFYDNDRYRKPYLFSGHDSYCFSTYKNNGGKDDFVFDCKVAKEFEFDEGLFTPSPNGTFTFNIIDSANLNMTLFKKLKIIIWGSVVPIVDFESRRKQRFLRMIDDMNMKSPYPKYGFY